LAVGVCGVAVDLRDKSFDGGICPETRIGLTELEERVHVAHDFGNLLNG
jgi:hypothetical protein